MKIRSGKYASPLAAVCNVLLACFVYFACRVAFVWENWSLYAEGWGDLSVWQLLLGGLRFDIAAIAYTNILYALLMFIPCKVRDRSWWQTMCKWIFVVVNSLAVVINLSDSVYSQYTGRRTTNTFFREFSNDGNLGTIFFGELLNHWYLILVGAALIALLWFCYVRVGERRTEDSGGALRYYILSSLMCLLLLAAAVVGIRGGFGLRPLSISSANQYVNRPEECNMVLNTPYTLIRTIGKTTYIDPHYLPDDEMERLYTPLHNSGMEPDTMLYKKNVVFLIVESFGQEYFGFHNKDLEPGYKGYTPFLDSLLALSLTWENTFANGRRSIDAAPALLASIPMFVEPFFFSGYSLNKLDGIATLLNREGYHTAFFHGANNGSMNFEYFTRTAGFQNYYGRDEYEADPRFGGAADFDGTWAIWDEPFLQYYVAQMNEMPQPFLSALFTATSHHPFRIPESYREVYPEEALPIHKCIRYTDNALRRFFAVASKQPWFKNTIFVFSADHTNTSNHDLYRTAMGAYRVPIFIYDPSGTLPTGVRPGTAQQIDVLPTLLHILGYRKPFVAFGNDLLQTPPEDTWTINYANGMYQFTQRDTLVQFDGNRVVGVYDLRNDPYTHHPLTQTPKGAEKRIKAIIQQYMQRMVSDRLSAANESGKKH